MWHGKSIVNMHLYSLNETVITEEIASAFHQHFNNYRFNELLSNDQDLKSHSYKAQIAPKLHEEDLEQLISDKTKTQFWHVPLHAMQ